MKYLSLFTGIGGFELGIQYAFAEKYYPNEWEEKNSPQCIGYSEIDKYAIQIYSKWFKQKNYGNISKINAKELPDFDLLVGGFPCQSFSIAGKRKGFDDTRGTLFFDIARILADKKPKYLLLENVKGLLSHDGGRTFQTIIGILTDLGYFIEWQVLNSKNFGVPQNRERVFIIGHLRGQPRPKVFPIGETTKKIIKTKKLSEPISNCLRTNYSNGHSNETYIKQLNKPKHSNNRIYSDEGLSPTLNTAQGGNRQPFIAAERGRYNEDGSISQRLESRKDNISNTLTGVEKDNRVVCKNPFIQSNPHGFNKGGKRKIPNVRESAIQNEFVNGIRKLTPIECERLQGFLDDWTKYGINEKGEQVDISDTQRYKTLGNAVTVNVVREIIKKLIIN